MARITEFLLIIEDTFVNLVCTTYIDIASKMKEDRKLVVQFQQTIEKFELFHI